MTLARPGVVGAQVVDRVALVQQWTELRNRGDIEAVMGMMTDNAVAAHGPCPLQSPCVGEANRSTIAGLSQNTITSIEARGSLVVGQQEVLHSVVQQVVGQQEVSQQLLWHLCHQWLLQHLDSQQLLSQIPSLTLKA